MKELDSLTTDDTTDASNGILFTLKFLLALCKTILEGLIASPMDEQWFEAPVTGTELQSVDSRGPRMSTTHQEFVEAENARDATIRELEQFLVEFRNGKLRSCMFFT